MRSKPLLALLLASSLVLAGCLGGDPTGDGTATTDLPGTTDVDDGTTTAESAATLPPGVTEDGLSNVSALVAAHERALAGTAYTFEHRTETAVDGETTLEVVRRGTVAAWFESFEVVSEYGSSPDDFGHYRSHVWANDSVALVERETPESVQYSRRDRTGRVGDGSEPTATMSSTVSSFLRSGEFEVVGTDRVDGRTLTTLRATEPSANGRFENGSEYDATVVVDSTGYVREFRRTVEADGTTDRGEFELTPREDVSIDRPEWAEDALAAVSADVDVTTERNHIEIVHGGGDVLPAGSTIRIEHDGETHALEFDRTLEPGETAHLHYSVDGGDPVLSDERPPNDAGERIEGSYSVTIADSDGNPVLSMGFGVGYGEDTEGTGSAEGGSS